MHIYNFVLLLFTDAELGYYGVLRDRGPTAEPTPGPALRGHPNQRPQHGRIPRICRVSSSSSIQKYKH